MKKNKFCEESSGFLPMKKLLLMAKITSLLMLITFLQVSANSFSQTGIVDLSMKNVSLIEVFQQIEEESNYRFFYDNEQVDLTRLVTIESDSKELSTILTELFNGTDLTYEMMDNLILVKSKTGIKRNSNTVASGDQQSQINGKVSDINGISLPGVTVVVKGTTNGTVTDIDGNYTLSNIPSGAILQFSFVGMQTEEIAVEGQTTINATLKEDMIGIEEVVAIGYGTQKKETVTGAITQVSTEDVAMSPSVKLTDGLAGRLSGVIINQRGGQPGRTETEIFIRGRSTIDAADNDGDGEPDYNSTAPLYVIDGIARDYNGLDRLDPNEIESLTILKDASAAIYGARAANGVILITTKRGAIGKPTIQFSYNHGFSQPTRMENLANSVQYAETWNLVNEIRGMSPQYSAEEIKKFSDGSDPLLYPNTNWNDVVYKNWNSQDKANVSVRGGSENVKYFISTGYLNQGSPFNDGFSYNKQYNVRSNIDATINKNLTVSLDLSGRLDDILSADVDLPHISLGYPYVNAIFPGTDYYANARTGDNVLQMVQDKEYAYTATDRGVLTGSLSATYQIPGVDGLSLSGTFAYDYNKNYEKDYVGVTYVYSYNPSSGEFVQERNSHSSTPQLNVGFNQGKSQTANIRLGYSNTFKNVHNIDAFVAYEQNKRHLDIFSAGRSQFLSGALHELFAGTADKNYQTNSGKAFESARQNYFGRIQYDYANKYMFQFQLRRDGSQNFASNKRWGWFPGVSAGWTITQEDFMQGINGLDFLKLRGSWGQLGNDNVNAFQYLTAYSFNINNDDDFDYVFGGTTAQGLKQEGAPNPNITWEVAETLDLGLEARMWGGKLGLDVDLFKTTRSNILAPRNASVPLYTGLELPDENIGIVENKGIELMLTNRGQIGSDLKYALSGNFTYVHNEVIDIDEAPMSEDYQLQTGKPIGAPLLYEVIGIFKDEVEIASYPARPGAIPGDLKIRDANDDGAINSLDQVRQDLTSSPEIVFGFNTNFEYKNFELNLSFQGQSRVMVQSLSLLPYDPSAWGNFNAWLLDDGWSPTNTDATKPRPGLGFFNGWASTDFIYRNGAFIRLKNAELAYNLPKSLLQNVGINACRVYISGYNLFLIDGDGLKDIGADPELSFSFARPVSPERVINLGFNLTF